MLERCGQQEVSLTCNTWFSLQEIKDSSLFGMDFHHVNKSVKGETDLDLAEIVRTLLL